MGKPCSDSEIRAMVEEAHSAGLKSSSHAQGNLGIKNALWAGVDVIEHGVFLDEEAINLLLKQDAFLVPTLAIAQSIAQKGAQAGLPELHLEKARPISKVHLESFQNAWKAGVRIGFGTNFLSDPLTSMGSNAQELELYVQAGCTPMEAIRI